MVIRRTSFNQGKHLVARLNLSSKRFKRVKHRSMEHAEVESRARAKQTRATFYPSWRRRLRQCPTTKTTKTDEADVLNKRQRTNQVR